MRWSQAEPIGASKSSAATRRDKRERLLEVLTLVSAAETLTPRRPLWILAAFSGLRFFAWSGHDNLLDYGGFLILSAMRKRSKVESNFYLHVREVFPLNHLLKASKNNDFSYLSV